MEEDTEAVVADKPKYDSPILMEADRLFGKRRSASGAGKYNAKELLQSMESLLDIKKKKRGKKRVEKPKMEPDAGQD